MSQEGMLRLESLDSPISSVEEYYGTQHISSSFDYSYLDQHGWHPIRGVAGNVVRNLLVLLSREVVSGRRNALFSFTQSFLNDLPNTEEFRDALIQQPEITLQQIDLIGNNDEELLRASLVELTGWLYFYLNSRLLEDGEGNAFVSTFLGVLLESSAISAQVILSQLNEIDSEFIPTFSTPESYRRLFQAATSESSNRQTLSQIAYFSRETWGAVNDEWALAARSGVPEHQSIPTEVINAILSGIRPVSPRFLPQTQDRSRQFVAHQILRYFDFRLPQLDEVATALGVQILRLDLPDDLLGLYVGNIRRHAPVIVVNEQARNEGSRNFTIGHELGHYLLHTFEPIFACGDMELYGSSQDAESQANEFSTELLMPVQAIRDHLNAQFSIQNVRDIASACNVSFEAAARRRIELTQNRNIALAVVVGEMIQRIYGSTINEEGLRWIGRASVGRNAVSLTQARRLSEQRVANLSRFFPGVQRLELADLEIAVLPFENGEGYYLFLERG
ncbi:MAG: ImmA/IrrE family metallo-endopeptidase [Sideroxydans sp.]|nr:ImmA/IrrE family metallo-endopeptidase [Sideroxydans sp.]